MGRIRIASFRRAEAHLSPQPILKDALQEAKTEHVEHVEHIETKPERPRYPILSRKTKEADLPFIPANEVKKRTGQGGEDRLWIVVSNVVLDVSDYVHKHPGGRSIITGFAGQDCTWQWYSFHNRTIWEKVAEELRVGRTEGVRNPYKRPLGIVGLRKLGFDDWD